MHAAPEDMVGHDEHLREMRNGAVCPVSRRRRMCALSVTSGIVVSLVGAMLFAHWNQRRSSELQLGKPGVDCNTFPPSDAMVHQGLLRCWEMYAPPIRDAENAALVIDLHGWHYTSSQQRRWSGLERIAKSESVYAVWPNGYEGQWKSSPTPSLGPADDVAFLRALVGKVADEYGGVNRSRVYLMGHSNGCWMALRAAAEASDVFAAVACVSGFLMEPEPDVPQRFPVGELELHCLDDPANSYYPTAWSPGARRTLNAWRRRNNCTGLLRERWSNASSVFMEHTSCASGGAAAHVALTDCGGNLSGHWPYPDARRDRWGLDPLPEDVMHIAWRFVREFTREEWVAV